MLATFLALATLATAIPLMGRQAGNYPPLSKSKAFTLVANITVPGKLAQDRFAEINHLPVSLARVGAGQFIPTFEPESPATFWQNDTTIGVDPRPRVSYTLLTDSGLQYLLGLWRARTDQDSDNDRHTVTTAFERAGGDVGFYISGGLPTAELYPALPKETAGTFAMCIGFGAPVHPRLTLEIIEATVYEDGVDNELTFYTPENCAQVALLPQCAEVPELPEMAEYDREFAMEVSCYEDVAGIDWSKYDAPWF